MAETSCVLMPLYCNMKDICLVAPVVKYICVCYNLIHNVQPAWKLASSIQGRPTNWNWSGQSGIHKQMNPKPKYKEQVPQPDYI